MPACYVHEALAVDACEAAGMAAGCEAALRTGAQGPDPLFFYRFFQRAQNRPVSALGSRLHGERTADFLLALLERAEEAGDAARAYALGFLAHYAVDSTVHPFVYARAFNGYGRYSTNLHCGLEAAFDTWLYRQRGGRGIPMQMTGIAALPREDAAAIARVLAKAVAQVFPEVKIDEAVVLGSFRWAVRIARLLHSPSGIKYRLFAWIAGLAGMSGLVEAHAIPRRLPGWDFTNAAEQGWCSPWAPELCSHKSLFTLFSDATGRAAALMREADALWSGDTTASAMRKTLGDLHYDSGLPWRETAPMLEDQLFSLQRDGFLTQRDGR